MDERREQDRLRRRTIEDFGEQWLEFPDNRGYYASVELLADAFGPLLSLGELANARVAEIGSGTGRIARLLLEAGAAHVVAVEPSAAFAVLERALAPWGKRVTLVHAGGEQPLPVGDLDYVVAIGVLHHVPDPDPVVRSAYDALRPGGRCFAWLYGREGNTLYLALLAPLRAVTRRLPHRALERLVRALELALRPYIALCRRVRLPLGRYLTEVLGRFAPAERRLAIYDQLNPAYARYYTREEARALLARAGFVDVTLHHRHGYSWSVIGTKPEAGGSGKMPPDRTLSRPGGRHDA